MSARLASVIGFGLVVLMYLFIVVVVTVCAYVTDKDGFHEAKRVYISGPLAYLGLFYGLGKSLVIWSHGHTFYKICKIKMF